MKPLILAAAWLTLLNIAAASPVAAQAGGAEGRSVALTFDDLPMTGNDRH